MSAQLGSGARLVTLTGPGGTGKTSLALEVAAQLVDGFPGGLYFVALAGVSDPDQVLATVADALEVSPPRTSRSRRRCRCHSGAPARSGPCWTTSSRCSPPPGCWSTCWGGRRA